MSGTTPKHELSEVPLSFDRGLAYSSEEVVIAALLHDFTINLVKSYY